VTTVEGVDLVTLAHWMDRRDLGCGPIEEAELIAGGTQNVLMRFHRDGKEYVLRRPPLHKRANSDETMRREARVLTALARSPVPHPAVIASESATDVLGAAFYLMEPVSGFNPSLGLPEPCRSAEWQHEMGLSMVHAVLTLAEFDHVAAGLSDLGRWDDWAQRQVARWRRQLDGYSELPGYAGAQLPGVDDIGAWLDQHLPAHPTPGLIHGDFHFANVLMSTDRPAVAAIVDWELVTIGDPLLDLGHLLATWPGSEAAWATALPSVDEVIDRYATHSSRPLDDLAWYRVLACYRLALILEGTNARAAAGLAPRHTGDLLHAHSVALLHQAESLIAS
jgi:aminoglycoside phosphotransferase (APT) family kinase protein